MGSLKARPQTPLSTGRLLSTTAILATPLLGRRPFNAWHLDLGAVPTLNVKVRVLVWILGVQGKELVAHD